MPVKCLLICPRQGRADQARPGGSDETRLENFFALNGFSKERREVSHESRRADRAGSTEHERQRVVSPPAPNWPFFCIPQNVKHVPLSLRARPMKPFRNLFGIIGQRNESIDSFGQTRCSLARSPFTRPPVVDSQLNVFLFPSSP